ncbi:mothers against decapentaplegic homolog 6 [Prorops nasuta]|uniref:mothers against decapentaplegic homolog 6 n=1 Tax=Prorops nasuta TaxID=863751 RepID=UPI0034CF968E
MFMFRSKRTVLTRRLLKAKIRGEHETECEVQEDSSRINCSRTTSLASNTENASNDATPPTSNQRNRQHQQQTVQVVVASAGGGGTTGGKRKSLTGRVAGGGGQARGLSRTCSTASKLQQSCCGGDRNHEDDDEDPARLLRCKELLKRLEENQLEMLLAAVESCGSVLGSCVLVPRLHSREDPYDCQQQQQSCYDHHHHHHFHHLHHHYHPRLGHQRSYCLSTYEESPEEGGGGGGGGGNPMKPERCKIPARASLESSDAPFEPHLLSCQIWRWPDLVHTSELKRLPVCHSAKDPVFICCNPYHWSRLCKPESPPPPYCLIPDRLKAEDCTPSERDQRWGKNIASLQLSGSLTTNGEGESGQKEWCTLAYWELGGRVGRLYPVEPSTVNVFDSLHDGDGLCLASLAENRVAPPAVERTRSKIGLGLMLSQESDGVWAYNRSDSPIFVNSPTLDDPESRTVLVYRVPPGCCLNIFDRAKILQSPSYGSVRASSTAPGFAASGPVDVNSVRISFAKGWGPKYSRQEVTSCPCWLEVLLAPCR